MRPKSIRLLLLGLVMAVLYFYLFYYVQRWESLQLISLYGLLFIGYLVLINPKFKLQLSHLLWLALIFRLIPIIAVPNLSDDFYRFIWDGLVWSNGINPFYLTPNVLIDSNLLDSNEYIIGIYELLNSQTTYTVYPTIPQLINLVAVNLFPKNLLGTIVVMRVFLLIAEIGTIYFLVKLLKFYNKDIKLVALYALNPLVIIELTGNLHHEGLMILFFFGFLYFFVRGKTSLSAGFMALSIASKLLPLMFIPFILIRTKDRMKFAIILVLGLSVLFLPLLDQSFFIGMKSSLSLYYQKFEFNAGLYYLARTIGYWYYDYNAIALIGKIFFVLATFGIGFLSFAGVRKNNDELTVFTLIYLVFTLLSLILHPWYILLLLALAPLTNFRFSIPWTFLIFLTYIGYSQTGFQENYWIVSIEYIGLIIALYYDLKNYAFSKATLNEAP